MGRQPAIRKTTDAWTCAEPSCPRGVTPRKGGATYFLHCEVHRHRYTPLPEDFPAPPQAYGRYTCTNCNALYEKYRSAVRGDGPTFCTMACRNEMGPRGGTSTIPLQQCENPDCRNGGWFRPPTRTVPRRFCDVVCFDDFRAAQPYSRNRVTENNAADMAEVRICEEPGCRRRLPPRDPVNGYKTKRCEEHRRSGANHGRPRDDSKMVDLTCANEDCPFGENGEPAKFRRYKSAIKNNTTGRFFCSDTCRGEAGARPNRQEWHECQWEDCEDPMFLGSPGAPNKYCSVAHRAADQNKQTPRVCPGEACGHRTFYKPACDPDIFCSRDCFDDCNQTEYGKRERTGDGYIRVYVPGHSEAQASGWALEHRVVMADHLGRKLAEGSSVHHRNKIPSDNRIGNLEYWLGNHGPGARHDDVVHHLLTVLAESNPEKAEQLSKVYGGPASTASYLPKEDPPPSAA